MNLSDVGNGEESLQLLFSCSAKGEEFGSRRTEKEREICRHLTWFPGRHGLWLYRMCLPELGAEIKSSARSKRSVGLTVGMGRGKEGCSWCFLSDLGMRQRELGLRGGGGSGRGLQ